ncbi:MAG: hypothetical protein LBL30_04505, partial [Holosporales bacterium]|nr:hypothetical protein [Holosporales bacterium]
MKKCGTIMGHNNYDELKNMKYKWIKTKSVGVRYREHPIRKHGQLRKDRYYTIRYRLDGRVKEERIGWESQGATERKAAI